MSNATNGIHIWVPGIRDDTGGIQAFSRIFVTALREGFPDRPIRVFVKNEDLDPDDPLKTAGVAMHSLRHVPGPLRSAAMASVGLMHGLRERPACTLSTHLHFLPALRMLRSLTGIPYGGVLHGIEAWKISSRSRIKALQGADLLMAVSHFTRDRVIADYGLADNQVAVVPNTFDGNRFTPGPKPAHLLARYGLRPDQPVILTVSRLALSERYKGHWQVLIALHWIREVFPDVHYVIVGTGDELQHLSSAVQALGLESNVTFAGFVPTSELADHYRLCDAFVMPSTKEGFGIVFLEAAACGKPVIAGNSDGSVDAVDHGRLGIMVDPHRPRQIADAAISALKKTNPNALLFDPEALSRAVSDTFGYKAVKKRLIAEVSGLLERPVGRHIKAGPAWIKTQAASLARPDEQPHAPRIVVLTQLNSPYQVEFFNRVAMSGDCHLEVIYLTHQDRSRQWVSPEICHSHIILSEHPHLQANAVESLLSADLAVFNYYTDIFALRAIRQRAKSGRPWVFWGERPGYFHLGPPAGLFRRFALAPLHRSHAPIWGIGRFGVDGYRQEFGENRPYCNLSYYSNLSRFQVRRQKGRGARTILYSGSMIPRKGVDLLARAFVAVAAENPDVRLLLVGDGELVPEVKTIVARYADRVEWAGFQAWNTLPDFYARADIFCLPSRYDGWALALVEALAAGLPSIATDQTGAALEFVSEANGNGWLIPADDPAALVQALRKAIALPADALEAMGEKARQSVMAHSLADGAELFVSASREAIARWDA